LDVEAIEPPIFPTLLNHRNGPSGAFVIEDQFASRPLGEHLPETILRREDRGEKHIPAPQEPAEAPMV
jgi:hypothetical protein